MQLNPPKDISPSFIAEIPTHSNAPGNHYQKTATPRFLSLNRGGTFSFLFYERTHKTPVAHIQTREPRDSLSSKRHTDSQSNGQGRERERKKGKKKKKKEIAKAFGRLEAASVPRFKYCKLLQFPNGMQLRRGNFKLNTRFLLQCNFWLSIAYK